MAGRKLLRYASPDSRAVAYYLRLPDGNPDGSGYAGTGRQSLRGLREGRPLDAIDASARYRSWSELVATLHALVRREAAGSPSVWLNVHDSSTTHNPRSHSDHYHAGQLADAVATLEPCVGRALYRDYATASDPANLGSNDLINKVAAWGATNSALVD